MALEEAFGAAMTGLQPSPTTSGGTEGTDRVVSIKEVASACGVRFAEELDARDFEGTVECIKKAMACPGPAVVVAKSSCTKQRGTG